MGKCSCSDSQAGKSPWIWGFSGPLLWDLGLPGGFVCGFMNYKLFRSLQAKRGLIWYQQKRIPKGGACSVFPWTGLTKHPLCRCLHPKPRLSPLCCAGTFRVSSCTFVMLLQTAPCLWKCWYTKMGLKIHGKVVYFFIFYFFAFISFLDAQSPVQ